MSKIKELTDFYMWMQENDYEHNIRARVERKAKQYLNGINARQSKQLCSCDTPLIRSSDKGGEYCGICEKDL